ncbi:MAG: 2-polyprenylphenol 6-hydroxylase, partial [Alphaproteobacteria bacterium]
MIRALRNLRRLWRIAATLARHDALAWLGEASGPPPAPVALALRVLRPRAPVPGRPGARLAAALAA